jgi:hypothetical protein
MSYEPLGSIGRLIPPDMVEVEFWIDSSADWMSGSENYYRN